MFVLKILNFWKKKLFPFLRHQKIIKWSSFVYFNFWRKLGRDENTMKLRVSSRPKLNGLLQKHEQTKVGCDEKCSSASTEETADVNVDCQYLCPCCRRLRLKFKYFCFSKFSFFQNTFDIKTCVGLLCNPMYLITLLIAKHIQMFDPCVSKAHCGYNSFH